MSDDIRTLLEEMVNDPDTYPLETHPGRLQEIAQIVPHTISPLKSSEPIATYNCVMHALGLVGRMTEYPHPVRCVTTEFLGILVADVLKSCNPKIEALVTWSAGGSLQHIGKLTAPNRAESKWGAGILCKHGIDELPARYGNVSGFYDPIDPESTLRHLHRFTFGS